MSGASSRPDLLSEQSIAICSGTAFAAYGPHPYIQFTAYIPPLAYQTSKRFVPKRVKAYMQGVTATALQARADYAEESAFEAMWSRDDIYRLAIRAYFADRIVRDCDNIAQPVQNALKGVLYQDDSQVQVLSVAKFLDREDPRVTVLVQVLGGGS